VVDAEEGRIVHETLMPNVGDKLHHFGWNRCSSACHRPNRSHVIVPGFRSSTLALDKEGLSALDARLVLALGVEAGVVRAQTQPRLTRSGRSHAVATGTP
jgi:selenium-binding protein 1